MAKKQNGIVAKIGLYITVAGIIAGSVMYVVTGIGSARASGDRANTRLDSLGPRLEKIERNQERMIDLLLTKGK